MKRSSFSKKRPEKPTKGSKPRGQRPIKKGGRGPPSGARRSRDDKRGKRSTAVPLTPKTTHKQ
jgi:hypothetical protein